jgi:hypothetical protein
MSNLDIDKGKAPAASPRQIGQESCIAIAPEPSPMLDDDHQSPDMAQLDRFAGSPESLPEQPVDGEGGDGAGPLLALTSQITTVIENAAEYPARYADSNPMALRSPLLGTMSIKKSPPSGEAKPLKYIAFLALEDSWRSSRRRSSESVCYDNLLREHPPRSGRKSQKTVPIERRGCSGS